MALKRATFTLTATAGGDGEATVHLPINSSPLRHAFLEAVSFDDSAATRPMGTFSLFESDSSDSESIQVFSIDGSTIPLMQYGAPGTVSPRRAAVDEAGVATTSYSTRVPLRSAYLRARADGLAVGDVYTVQVYYETSGDYRF